MNFVNNDGLYQINEPVKEKTNNKIIFEIKGELKDVLGILKYTDSKGAIVNAELNPIQSLRDAYPRVTKILEKQTLAEMRSIPTDRLITASLRGSAVHNYCTTYLERLFMPDIEEQYSPYVTAFIQWAERNIKEVLHTRQRYYDDDLQFSGEPDAILILKDSDVPTLIDIKATCTVSKTWALQLGAYQHLCVKNGINIGRSMNIHLKKSVKTQTENIQGEKVRFSIPVICAKEILPPIDFNESWKIFHSALLCFNYFDRKEERECLPMNPL